MLVFTAVAALLVRYYLLSSEDFNSVGLKVKDNVVSDFKSVTASAYSAGVSARKLYDTYSVQVVEAYNKVAVKVSSRFSK